MEHLIEPVQKILYAQNAKNQSLAKDNFHPKNNISMI
jgi:hypothetical protein